MREERGVHHLAGSGRVVSLDRVSDHSKVVQSLLMECFIITREMHYGRYSGLLQNSGGEKKTSPSERAIVTIV